MKNTKTFLVVGTAMAVGMAAFAYASPPITSSNVSPTVENGPMQTILQAANAQNRQMSNPRKNTTAPSKGPSLSAKKPKRKVVQAPYGFPLNAGSYGWLEYTSTVVHAKGIQAEGFDFGIKKWRNKNKKSTQASLGKWSGVKDGISQEDWSNKARNNDDFLMYGDGVYAMAAGQVVGCWRNAPENPRSYSPGLGDDLSEESCKSKPWLHKEVCTKKIPGGGNMLWIQQDDGVTALYAHMIPGSISKKLCPHNNKYRAEVEDSAVENGARVKRGQFLGKVGNSGSSTDTHLHVHMEKADKAVPIRFTTGLSAYMSSDDSVNWKSFAGKIVPRKSGQTSLIWPAHLDKNNRTFKKIPGDKYQGLVEHMVGSGMWPGLVTCKSSKNGVTYNALDWWQAPKNADWYTRHGLSAAQYKAEKAKAAKLGYKVTSKYSCKNGNKSNFVVVFKKP